MSQGRISYSRIIAVGAILFVFSASGYLFGRISPPVIVTQSVDTTGLRNNHTEASGAKTALGTVSADILDSTGEPSDAGSPSASTGIQLAWRNAVTIVPPFNRVPTISTHTKADFGPGRGIEGGQLFRPNDISPRDISRLFYRFPHTVKMKAPVSALGKTDRSHSPGKGDGMRQTTEFSDPSKLFFKIAASKHFDNGDVAATKGLVSLSPMHFQTTPMRLWVNFGVPPWHDKSGKHGMPFQKVQIRNTGGDGIYFGGLTEREFRSRETRCLAKAIYHEARGETQEGQFAVAQTIMNRVRISYFPDTICGVIYENSHRRNKCQFSFACDGISDKPKNLKLWKVAIENARKVVAGQVWLDDIGNASHYHATYVRPKWRKYMNRIKRIGVHIFYRAKYLPLTDDLALEKARHAVRSAN